MAIREIRLSNDEILRKTSREVETVDDRIKELLDDMVETMHKYNGVGLAGPQVGVLKRVIVIDLYDGEEPLKIKFRTLSDAEVNECVAKNDEDDPNIGDKWAMYLSAVEPSLKDLANAMKESGDISYPMEIFEMFQRHEITEASTIIMEKSGVIGKDKVTVVDKAIENLKN